MGVTMGIPISGKSFYIEQQLLSVLGLIALDIIY